MKFTSGLKHRNNIYLSKFVVNMGNIEYNQSILLTRKSWRKEVVQMTSFDLIWRLIELLLQEKELHNETTKSKADDQKKD